MTVTEQQHSDMVRQLSKPGADIISEMTAQQAHLLHMAVGVSGEAGELLDAVKKHVIYGKPLDFDNMIEELGDLEFYMNGVRQALCLGRQRILEANMKKLAKRYGAKYTNVAAQERKDKQS